MHVRSSLRLLASLALLIVLALAALPTGAAPAPATGGAAELANAGRLVYLPLIRSVAAPQPPPPPQPIQAETTLRPVPLREVQRGTTLSVEYRFRNTGAQAISSDLSLFYQSRLMNFTTLDSADRVLSIDTSRVVLRLNNVAPGETRVGRANFLVLGNAPVGSQIAVYAEFACGTGSTCRSNFAEVQVVRNQSETPSGGTFTMSVSPDRGPPGTAHTFAGFGFQPGERYVTWLNTPSGVQALTISGSADGEGRIRFTFGSGQLTQAGFYSMVARGQTSGTENIGPFIVQINGQPATVNDVEPAIGGGAALENDGQLTTATPAQAGGQGGVTGVVRDSAGNAVAGVAVEIADAAGQTVLVTTTGANGRYLVPVGLASGSYTVTARPSVNPQTPLVGLASLGNVNVVAPNLTFGADLTLPAAGGLTGRVLSGTTPTPGVLVTATASDGTQSGSDVSDATGTYTITNLLPGSYTLSFNPQGIAGAGLFQTSQLPAQNVVAGQIGNVSASPLRAAAATGIISGRVTDAASGAGVPDVLVVITGASDRVAGVVEIVTTADDGSYSSDPLRPGSYRVQFVTIFSQREATARYRGEFYNDATSFAASATVQVTAAQQTTADAGLSAGGSISGTVRRGDGTPVAGATVFALDASGTPQALARSSASGAYTLAGLAAGSYSVRAIPAADEGATLVPGGYDTSPETPALTPVEVGATTVGGIDITLAGGARLLGTVSAGDSGEPLPNVLVAFIADPRTSPTLVGLARTDTNGSYVSPSLPPGVYTIFFTTIFSDDSPARFYQDEFFNNKASLASADEIQLTGLNRIRNAELELGGSVSGTITLESGAGAAGVAVVARVGTTLVGSATTDEDGSYSLDGLPPGAVRITVDASRATDPGIRILEAAPVNVNVTVGTSIDQDFTLVIPG